MLLVRYAEIGLKGKNRAKFENKLIQNIKEKIGDVKIEKELCSILIDTDSSKIPLLKEVFGIAWIADVKVCPRDLEELKSKVLELIKSKNPKTFKITTNRADKSFPMNSVEISREIGKSCESQNYKVDLKNYELEIFIDVLKNRALIYTEKIQGPGGLPVGVSGKVLCLLSGGIDSPVAAWLIAKRGAKVDFLHFYSVRNKEELEQSKIPKIVAQLEKYLGKSTLWLIPIWDFQLATLNLEQYELQLFRRFMLKVAERLAKEKGYDAIVLGDSLAQVASQTISNLTVVEKWLDVTIFRPLIGFDKKETIELAKRIGTYELSIQPYKDCCALIAKKPKTSISFEKLQELEKEYKLDDIINSSLEKLKSLQNL